ncbi:MAG: F0F1 ATP synthase subunit delta [Gemmatimonadota bacterium]|nr:F0F1 ATP synthase subunit delta [Gemmatimonadota bacterium]
MITSSVAKEYAKALFMLAKRSGKIDRIGEELKELSRLVERNETVKNFLLAPQLSAETKLVVLDKALSGRVDNDLYKFLMVLTAKHRQGLLAEISAIYRAELNRHYNRIEVSISSAVELTDKENESLASRLSRHLEREILIRSTVDPRLLGGLVCRIGDVVYDGSLRNRFERLSNQMLKAKI